MNEDLNKIRDECFKQLKNLTSETDIYQFKSRYLGRNGSLTQVIKNLTNMQ